MKNAPEQQSPQAPESSFIRLARINVNDKVEKKGNLSYLSWAWAWDQLQRADPDSSFEYLEPKLFGETMMVYCTVMAFGKARTQHLPVMDNRNQPIKSPNAFQVNTAMQRCLVKAIALHGLGLYIYAGEDLPEGVETEKPAPAGESRITPTADAFESQDIDMQNHLLDIAHRVRTLIARGDIAGAWDELTAHDNELDEHQKVGLWSRLESQERSALKKEAERRKPAKVAA